MDDSNRDIALRLATGLRVHDNHVERAATVDEIIAAAARYADFLNGQTAAADLPNPQPAVPIDQSVQPDYIVCLEDGVKCQMLKRHIAGFGLTPQDYRRRWGLPADYPMVAPNYSMKRSALAKETGLGVRKRPSPKQRALV
jgi:predicted transcriptional regulator